MEEKIKEIASRLKGLRVLEEISAEQMAAKFNLTLQEYLTYESGEKDIPVGLLYEVATAFGMSLTEILSGETPKLHKFQVVRAGNGLDVRRRKDYKYESLAFNFLNKKAEIFIVKVPVTDANVTLNTHPGQEFNYMIKGSMLLVIDGQETQLNEGDSVIFDSSLDHGMKSVGGSPAEFLAIIM